MASRNTETAHTLDTDRVPVAELRTYHRNPRRGNVRAIADSLRTNGQYRPVVANRGTHTGRPNEVLAGNHTLLGARDLGWGTVVVSWVDVDDDQAARIVAADNRTADLGAYDDRLLAELLGDLPDLDGTGYDPGDLDDLLAQLDEDTTDLDDDGDGYDAETNYQERADRYEQSGTRSVVLEYGLDDYARVVQALTDLSDVWGLDSNAAVVDRAITQARDAAPASDPHDSEQG